MFDLFFYFVLIRRIFRQDLHTVICEPAVGRMRKSVFFSGRRRAVCGWTKKRITRLFLHLVSAEGEGEKGQSAGRGHSHGTFSFSNQCGETDYPFFHSDYPNRADTNFCRNKNRGMYENTPFLERYPQEEGVCS